MEAINEFYKDILVTLGLEIDSNGGIFIPSGKTKLPLTIEGLHAVLPTADNIKNVIDTSGEKAKLNYFLFNPAHEDPIRKNTSLQKLRDVIYRKLENKFAALMEILAVLGLDDNPKSMGTIDFVELVVRFRNNNIKKLFDDQVVTAVRDIYTASKKSTNPKSNLLHIFLNKGGKIGEDRYNKIGNAAFPVYETLINDFSVKNDTIEGIKLRNKDKGVIISAYEFIVKNKEDLVSGIIIGSKNKVAPGLHTLLIIMDNLIDMINNAADSLKEDLEDDVYNSICMNKPKIGLNEMDGFLTDLKEDIEYIPDEKSLEALIKQNTGTTGTRYVAPTRNVVTNQPQIQEQPSNQPDPLDLALNGGYRQQQQPMMMAPQPQMMQPNMMPQPQMMQPQQNYIDPVDAALMGGF